MSSDPTVSFIVPSYNYAHYIGQTIQSILCQTFTDFELIVIDDCSQDGSCDVIRSFNDDRIKLIVNDHNLGGSESFNRAFQSSRGHYIVNLDSDDWIEPEKTAKQLALTSADPSISIVGTWVSMVDQSGSPHPDAVELEAGTNREWDFNSIDTWIGRNALCRSSTLLHRSVHEECGTYSAKLVRAPDYDLWTRALKQGKKFALLPEKLTNYRVHAHGVTHADPRGTLLELTYSLIQNLLTLADQQRSQSVTAKALHWIEESAQFQRLEPTQQVRLLALLIYPSSFRDYAEFLSAVETSAMSGGVLTVTGQRLLALKTDYAERHTDLHRACQEVHRAYQDLHKANQDLHKANQDLNKAMEWHKQQAENWEREFQYWQKQAEEWERKANSLLRSAT